MRNYVLTILSLCLSSVLMAGIYCPPDVTVECQTNIHDLSITGTATPGGTYHGWEPSYEDWGEIPSCGSGSIIRKWWVDLDWDGKIDHHEPYCTQHIYVNHGGGDVTIEWPDDVHIGCDDPVPHSQPWISHGPCDLIATSVEDQYFDISNGVCSKILRHFTVINWCVYETGGTAGIYHYTQKIFFQDSEAPVLGACEDITLSTSDCKGTFTVSNSATDTGFCTSENISWIIKVDLDSNGSIDYEYNSNHNSGNFYIAPTSNGEEVTIELPIQVGIGWHNVIWKIYDGCGNVDYCSQMVKMKDTTPPTPICYTNLSTVLMPSSGMVELNVHTMIKEAYDNCSWPEWIKFSFTPEPGTETMIFDCDNQGVEMVQVYAIDTYGNYDYCKVMILFQDNAGTCPTMPAYSADVMDARGFGIQDVEMSFMKADGEMRDQVMSDHTGAFVFEDTQLSESLDLVPYKMADSDQLTVLDLLVLKNHLFGAHELNETAQYVGDVNQDGQLKFDDLLELKNMLLFGSEATLMFSHWSGHEESFIFKDKWSLWEAADKDRYYGFQLGDVSADYSKAIKKEIEVESRSKATLRSHYSDDVLNIYLGETACLNAIQFNMDLSHLSDSEVTEIISGQLNENQLEWTVTDQKLTIIWTEEACTSLDADAPLFSIDIAGLVNDNQVVLSSSNFMVKDNQFEEYQLILERSEETVSLEAEIQTIDNTINISVGDQVTYGYVVMDVNGSVVKSSRSESGNSSITMYDVPTGIYFVKLISNDSALSMNKACFIE